MPPGLARRESDDERGAGEEGEWCCERGKRKSNRSGLISGLQAHVALSLSVIATGGWRMDVSLVMVPIFREPYDAGRRKHQQHLINHNLSRIRVHYHQEVVGRGHSPPFPSVSGGLHGWKMRRETSCDSRQFLRGKTAGAWCTIAMVMCVLDAKETAEAEAGIWQRRDHNMSPLVFRAHTGHIATFSEWRDTSCDVQCLSTRIQTCSKRGRWFFFRTSNCIMIFDCENKIHKVHPRRRRIQILVSAFGWGHRLDVKPRI